MARLVDAGALAGGPRCRLLLQHRAGLEGRDVPEATRRGVWVSSFPYPDTGNALSCAEHALYLALALLQDQRGMAGVQMGHGLGQPRGKTLSGKRALVVGFGNIAQELIPSTRLGMFGVEVSCIRAGKWPDDAAIAADGGGGGDGGNSSGGGQQRCGLACAARPPSEKPSSSSAGAPDAGSGRADASAAGSGSAGIDAACGGDGSACSGGSGSLEALKGPAGLAAPGPPPPGLAQGLSRRGGPADLLDMVADVDLIFLTCPQTAETRGMINVEVLGRCKPGVRIINVARGGLLDYDATMEALGNGRISAVGLDVEWEEPFDQLRSKAT